MRDRKTTLQIGIEQPPYNLRNPELSPLKSISIIIPVKDEADNLRQCLQSIKVAAVDTIDFEVLVIDNGSEDDTLTVAQQYGAVILVDPNATVAGLRNQGADLAQGEILAFIDADCTVEPDWFRSLQTYIDDKSILVFGNPPGIPLASGWVERSWYQIRKRDNSSSVSFKVDWLESMNLFVRRDAFLDQKGFDTSLVTCEDYDFCQRINKHTDIICDTRIHAIHHGEAKTVRRFYSKERWRGLSNIAGIRQHGFSLTELPSVLLPLIQLMACGVALLTLALCLLGYAPFWLLAVGLVSWQLPLLYIAYRKTRKNHQTAQTGGLWILLNVYFTARGQSLFMQASWR